MSPRYVPSMLRLHVIIGTRHGNAIVSNSMYCLRSILSKQIAKPTADYLAAHSTIVARTSDKDLGPKQTMDDTMYDRDPMPLDDDDPDGNPAMQSLKQEIEALRKGLGAINAEYLSLYRELKEAKAQLAAVTESDNGPGEQGNRSAVQVQ